MLYVPPPPTSGNWGENTTTLHAKQQAKVNKHLTERCRKKSPIQVAGQVAKV